MREGRCCHRGNFPRTLLSGSRLSWPKFAKAKSGLVPTFQRREKKLAVSFGFCNSPRSGGTAQFRTLEGALDVIFTFANQRLGEVTTRTIFCTSGLKHAGHMWPVMAFVRPAMLLEIFK